MRDREGTGPQRVAVGSYASRPLAELARSYLEDHGVLASVDSDDGGGSQPEVGFVTGGAWLLVAADERDRAASLLAEVGDGPSLVRAPRPRAARWVAGTVAATMALLGVWTVVALLLFA